MSVRRVAKVESSSTTQGRRMTEVQGDATVVRVGREEEDREENVEGLVRKSKGFLPINLSNPKGVPFGVEEGKQLLSGHDGTGRVGGGILKATGLKEKNSGRLFSRYYSRLFQIIQSGSSFESFVPLIIYIQRVSCTLGLMVKMRRARKGSPFDIQKSFSYKHGPWAILYAGGNC